MTALRAFALGLKNGISSPGLLFTLYAVNVIVALPMALLFGAILGSGFGNSMAIERFLEGFDFAAFQDFLNHSRESMGAFFQVVSWVLFAYVFVNTLLAGGVLMLLKQGSGKFSLASFLSGCGQYFWRFLRLFLIYAVIIVLTMVIVGAILAGVYSYGAGDPDSEVTAIVWAVVVGSIAVAVLFSLFVLLDFAKVAAVHGDMRSMLKATGRSFAFVFRHLLSVKIVVVLILLLLVAGTAVYLLISSDLGMTNDIELILALFVQQVFILFRIYLRIAFYDCELTLYGHFAEAPRTVAAPSPVPVTAP